MRLPSPYLTRRTERLRFHFIAKKQCVAVLRAAKNILGLEYMPAMNLGGQLVFYRPIELIRDRVTARGCGLVAGDGAIFIAHRY